MSEIYAGLMSGTSADGLDACLAEFHGKGCRTLGHCHRRYDGALRGEVLAAMTDPRLSQVAALDVWLADEAAGAIADLLAHTGYPRAMVKAIGCHGQTVFHQPHGPTPTSIQISDPHRLAVRSGIDVVADFRRADIAAGGEGAPLAPGFHAAAFRSPHEDRAVLNIGGMANLSLLPAQGGAIRGFDSGPGNALLDLWCARATGQSHDPNGILADSGRYDPELLEALAGDPYFARRPPKSTGREYFNAAWLDGYIAATGKEALSAADVQATLAELTAVTIAGALTREAPATQQLIVCGGGINNADLMDRLRSHLAGVRIASSSDYGIDPQLVEALAFAWLARQRLHERPSNVPSVTGATREVVLGAHIRAPR